MEILAVIVLSAILVLVGSALTGIAIIIHKASHHFEEKGKE